MKRRFFLKLLLVVFVALFTSFGSLAQSQNQNVTVQFGIQIGPAHSATLSWVASTSPGITAYKVYRSVISGSGFSLIGQVSGATLTYTDGGLPAGNTYFYVITAVSASGESIFSNQVTGVVPTP